MQRKTIYNLFTLQATILTKNHTVPEIKVIEFNTNKHYIEIPVAMVDPFVENREEKSKGVLQVKFQVKNNNDQTELQQ